MVFTWLPPRKWLYMIFIQIKRPPQSRLLLGVCGFNFIAASNQGQAKAWHTLHALCIVWRRIFVQLEVQGKSIRSDVLEQPFLLYPLLLSLSVAFIPMWSRCWAYSDRQEHRQSSTSRWDVQSCGCLGMCFCGWFSGSSISRNIVSTLQAEDVLTAWAVADAGNGIDYTGWQILDTAFAFCSPFWRSIVLAFPRKLRVCLVSNKYAQKDEIMLQYCLLFWTCGLYRVSQWGAETLGSQQVSPRPLLYVCLRVYAIHDIHTALFFQNGREAVCKTMEKAFSFLCACQQLWPGVFIPLHCMEEVFSCRKGWDPDRDPKFAWFAQWPNEDDLVVRKRFSTQV